MAIVRFGNGISEMRGSIDGVVYSRSRAGATARNRITPVNPNTSFQSSVRAQFNLAVQTWKDMPSEEAALWVDFSQTLSRLNAIGESYTPAARQVFIESTMNLLRIGETPLPAAPVDKPDEPTVDLSAVVTVANETAGLMVALAVNDLVVQPHTSHLVFQATLPLPGSTQNLQRHFKEIATVTEASDNNLFTAYQARFGADVPADIGQVIGIRMKAVNADNGFATSWYYLPTIVGLAV